MPPHASLLRRKPSLICCAITPRMRNQRCRYSRCRRWAMARPHLRCSGPTLMRRTRIASPASGSIRLGIAVIPQRNQLLRYIIWSCGWIAANGADCPKVSSRIAQRQCCGLVGAGVAVAEPAPISVRDQNFLRISNEICRPSTEALAESNSCVPDTRAKGGALLNRFCALMLKVVPASTPLFSGVV